MCFLLEMEIRQLKSRIAQLEANLAAADQRVAEECSNGQKLCQLYAQAQERIKHLEGENAEMRLHIDEMTRRMQAGSTQRSESELASQNHQIETVVSNMDAQIDFQQTTKTTDHAYVVEKGGVLTIKGEGFIRDVIAESNAPGEIESGLIKGSHTNTPADCSVIDSRLQDNSQHQSKDDDIRPEVYMCDVCGEVYMQECFLLQHVLSRHKQLIVTEYQCAHCNKYYSNAAAVRGHIEIVHKGKKHQCLQCGKSYGQRGDLQRHIQAKHEGVRFECTLCHKKFTFLKQMRAHVKTHQGIYPHRCEICGMGLSSIKQFVKHRSIHMGLQQAKPSQDETKLSEPAKTPKIKRFQ